MKPKTKTLTNGVQSKNKRGVGKHQVNKKNAQTVQKEVRTKKTGKMNKKPKNDNKNGGTWDENENFEVERILDVYFKKTGQREFLVLWKGYPQSQSSWEPEENMNCPELINKYMEKVEKAKQFEAKELRVNRKPTNRLSAMSDRHLGRRLSKRFSDKERIYYHDAE